jgi:non-specific serine/threonine protein kinase
MAEIRLTPGGGLRWQRDSGDAPAIAAFGEAFEADWLEGLFRLAADKSAVAGSPTLRYWQGLAEQYLTGLCHIPESTEAIEVAPPTPAEFASLLLTVPPMVGGEYLSEAVLGGIWEALDGWVHEAVRAAGDLKTFLASQAPKWHQVGRVCFHLAENKGDPSNPFAFLATYATGFGSGGRLKHLPLGRALEQYAGAKNRAALINLLSPVQAAGEQCEWVGAMVESGHVYRPQAWSPGMAYRMLQDIPALETCGLSVRLPDWWKKRPRPRVSVKIGQVAAARLGADALLDFDVNAALGDEALSPQELATLLAGEDGLVWFKGQWIEVDREKLKEALEHWQAVQCDAESGRISFVEGMRLLAGASADLRHETQAEAQRSWVHVEAGEAMRQVLAGLRDPGRLGAVETGDGLKATLRPYQRDGLAWLHFLAELGLGACLADDMGLGKTLQVLALLLRYQGSGGAEDKRPSLLVVPASLLGNWRNEAGRFTPSLKLTFLHPAENGREAIDRIAADPQRQLVGADLAVTTYSMLVRQPWLTDVKWRLVILDEAQAIKNPSTRQAKASKNLPADARIVLTGTPVENRLGDLWSLFDFLNPGLLGSAKVFDGFVKSLEARSEDRFGPLRRLVGPYILRRLKTDRAIITDLPDKIETTCFCRLSKVQVRLYEAAVRTLGSMLAKAEGIARRGLVLQSLMRLKQICNHPSQLSGDGQYGPEDSGKFLRIAEICEEIASRQEKVLVFTQFREICEPLADYLARIFGRSGLVLHGGVATGKRSALIEAFGAEDGPPFFILSLKAGGTGLNLTAASHIIHFDRWWNPAVENQATDRAFRIGQHRNVLVHKCVTVGTVEERIDAMLAEKQKMADEILASDNEVNLTELSDNELLDLVRLDVSRAQLAAS